MSRPRTILSVGATVLVVQLVPAAHPVAALPPVDRRGSTTTQTLPSEDPTPAPPLLTVLPSGPRSAERFPMPRVRPVGPGPVQMPLVEPLEPGPVPMPQVPPGKLRPAPAPR